MNLNARINAVIRSTDRRNYFLGVVNGAFTQLGMNLTQPSLVLSVLVRALGGSNALIGSLSAIRFGGWFLPQFLVAGWVQPRQHKAPITVALEIVRMATYVAMGILTYALSLSSPGLLLFLLFTLFTFSRLTAGIGALARMDAIGKVVSPPRRASFFAARNFWGGLAVFGAGFLVRYVLDETHGQPFSFGFTLLFGLSAFCFLVALLVFAQIRESPGPDDRPHHSLRAQLARAPELVRRDPAFRRYVLIRALLNMTRLSEPFYPILALEVLGAPASMMGFYLSAQTLARILSNLVWQRLSRARGNYFLVKTATLLTVLGPLLAIVLPYLMRWAGLTVERAGLMPAYLFTVVFLIVGSGESGRSIGLMALLLDIAPDEERASYVGFVNTALGLVSFLPIIAGAIIDRVGFEPIFLTATALLFLGYLATVGWKRDHKR